MANNADVYWLDQAGRIPLLTSGEELHLGKLVRAWQDDPAGPDDAPPKIRRAGLKARDRIVAANLRLVASIAEKRPSPVPLEDRMQAGTIGLIRAAEKFDPARGYKFSTYAFAWIRQSIVKAIDDALLIHIPCNVTGALRGTVNSKVSESQMASGLRVWLGVASLDSPIQDVDGQHLIDVVPAPHDESNDNDDLLELRKRLEKLDSISYRLIAARWFAIPPVPFADICAAESLELREAKSLLRFAENQLHHKIGVKRKRMVANVIVTLCVSANGVIYSNAGQWLGKAGSQKQAEQFCIKAGWKYKLTDAVIKKSHFCKILAAHS
jgi:RNA polymerase sigma factor (sigma-70 family)